MSFSTTLKHVFRIYDGPVSLWHLLIVITFGASLGAYTGLSQLMHQGLELAVHWLYGVALASGCAVAEPLIDFLLFRRLYFYFEARDNQRACERVAYFSMWFAFAWVFLAFTICYLISPKP